MSTSALLPGGGSGAVPTGAQIGYAYTPSTTQASEAAAAIIPQDNTIPQNTEGVAFASLDTTITPSASSSLLEITVFLPLVSASAAQTPVFALFRDSGANAIHAEPFTVAGPDYAQPLTMKAVVVAGSTSATTFKLRWSGQSPGQTCYINRQSSVVRTFGGALQACMIVREIKQ